MVTPLDAYQQYLLNQAWVWEQQALVRSRFIVGDATLGQEFSDIRQQVLSQAREQSPLADDVIKMRERMREHLTKGKAIKGEAQPFDLKQSPGGLVDIEFLTQYLVLAFGHDHAKALTRWSDNIRILESAVAVGLLAEQEAERLKAAYCAIRNRGHRLSLLDEPGLVPDTELCTEREWVTESWEKWLQTPAPSA